MHMSLPERRKHNHVRSMKCLTFSKLMPLTSFASPLTDLYVHGRHFAVWESAYLSMRKVPSLKCMTILSEDLSTWSLVLSLWFPFGGCVYSMRFHDFIPILVFLCTSRSIGHRLHVPSTESGALLFITYTSSAYYFLAFHIKSDKSTQILMWD